jgi:hypothetical protein
MATKHHCFVFENIQKKEKREISQKKKEASHSRIQFDIYLFIYLLIYCVLVFFKERKEKKREKKREKKERKEYKKKCSQMKNY